MTTYIALLRGINVGGSARIAMKDLRALFAGMGFEDVRTYLQSGNVVFRTPAATTTAKSDATASAVPAAAGPQGPADLAVSIERRIADDLGVTCTVLLRTGDSLARTLAANPYRDREDDPAKLHVTFLAQEPTAEQAARLAVPAGETAVYTLAGDEIHLHVPDGYGRTRLNNTFIERRLGMRATTRNWKTVTALHRLAAGE
ncbi:DUF1697 domain-containing protein [Streptomyces sp. NRRL B-3648]|uniref:DUF1697 domain-containing protein n=1 Tax=Streptomyces sp. NRRL B-3648 TaxID=1519493 RepID=UPI0006AE5A0B|nr:DUF1697 domain-containing protein [Streptomyces sp. NRRL B-3648]KOX08493.1 hypothetical protein ADL04_03520 [Streptomyces sp. NRRL B-3648]